MASRAASHFAYEINSLIRRFRDEYDIAYCEVIGILFTQAHILAEEATEEEDGDVETFG